MATTTSTVILNIAIAGDQIHGSDLQASIDELRHQATRLNNDILAEPDILNQQTLMQKQLALRSMAIRLAAAQIGLLAGEANVTAEHVNAAIAYAKGVVDQIAGWRERLQKLAAVLSFFEAVLTGDGRAIVQAALVLKNNLDGP
jgi:subtilisin